MELCLYLACCALAYVFSRGYIGWFGPYIFWAILILPPALSCLSLPSMLRFKVCLRAPKSILRGEAAQLCLNFSGSRLLPLRACSFKLRIKNLLTGEESVQDMRFGLICPSDSYIPLPTQTSGRVVCSIEDLRCYAYLGLFKRKSSTAGFASMLVMPRARQPRELVDLESLSYPEPCYKAKPGGGYAEEHELRPYRPGDSMNSIHWKLSSKIDDIIIREPLEPIREDVSLVLDSFGEIDLDHLYWLSLRLCSLDRHHRIYWAGRVSQRIENETDSARAMIQLLSQSPSSPLSGPKAEAKSGRIFHICKGEVTTG